MSASFQDNLEYMFKHFGFYLPDAEYLTDPEGLVQYLGEKLTYGHVPLYTSGDDPNAKQFRSLHAVQRHMVDTNQCKMLYEGNEEEYEEFYDYAEQEADAEGESTTAVAVSSAPWLRVARIYALHCQDPPDTSADLACVPGSSVWFESSCVVENSISLVRLTVMLCSLVKVLSRQHLVLSWL